MIEVYYVAYCNWTIGVHEVCTKKYSSGPSVFVWHVGVLLAFANNVLRTREHQIINEHLVCNKYVQYIQRGRERERERKSTMGRHCFETFKVWSHCHLPSHVAYYKVNWKSTHPWLDTHPDRTLYTHTRICRDTNVVCLCILYIEIQIYIHIHVYVMRHFVNYHIFGYMLITSYLFLHFPPYRFAPVCKRNFMKNCLPKLPGWGYLEN